MALVRKYWKLVISLAGVLVTLLLVHFAGSSLGEEGGATLRVIEGIILLVGLASSIGLAAKANLVDEADDIKDMLKNAVKQAKVMHASGKTGVKESLIVAVGQVMAQANSPSKTVEPPAADEKAPAKRG